MNYKIRKATGKDNRGVRAIVNYFIRHSLSYYAGKRIPSCKGCIKYIKTTFGNSIYVVENEGKEIVGYGRLERPHGNERSALDRVAELCYFILPIHTGKGVGTRLLKVLKKDAKNLGIKTLLAHICSLNTQSLSFHKKNGFAEVGRISFPTRKNGKVFDVVWMRRFI
ncbi:MAG: GNAT family N-acetyltransferase [Elusimicrobiaceae bacterium]